MLTKVPPPYNNNNNKAAAAVVATKIPCHPSFVFPVKKSMIGTPPHWPLPRDYEEFVMQMFHVLKKFTKRHLVRHAITTIRTIRRTT